MLGSLTHSDEACGEFIYRVHISLNAILPLAHLGTEFLIRHVAQMPKKSDDKQNVVLREYIKTDLKKIIGLSVNSKSGLCHKVGLRRAMQHRQYDERTC